MVLDVTSVVNVGLMSVAMLAAVDELSVFVLETLSVLELVKGPVLPAVAVNEV